MRKRRRLPGQDKLSGDPMDLLVAEYQREQDDAARTVRLNRFDVARGLRDLRLRLDLTQAEMAKALDISNRTYAAYELGQREVPSGVLATIYARFNVNLHVLLTGEAIVPTPPEKMASCDYVFQVADEVAQRFPDLDQSEIQSMTRQYLKHAEIGGAIDGGALLQIYDLLFRPDDE
ncbi:putative transcriptional regulators [Mesorhizobium sp. J18]|uniref:helix-turn-helix domain-containing protein n=1 Tax=Mesorhizobium sp. J18 TaxID=935263 RepID=UPI00119C0855|nr:helix-turn-helix transcriptional regulator [Mesorhizobium sp. J18]TWG91005.1 putative transcriptional regulators [Mesorhizobium sp. J18]